MAFVWRIVRKVRKINPLKYLNTETGNVSETSAVWGNAIANFLSPFEFYVVSIQSLLIWERPYHSALAVVAVNCIFWFVYFHCADFYFLIVLSTLIVFLYKSWVDWIWPEIRVAPPENEDMEEWTPIHPQVYSVPELSQLVNDCWSACEAWRQWYWQLRQDCPGVFCILTCSVLTGLAFIGHIFPGVVIMYTVVMTVCLAPGLTLHVIPLSWKERARDIVTMITSNVPNMQCSDAEHEKLPETVETDSELDEFLPHFPKECLNRELSLTEDRAQEDIASEQGKAESLPLVSESFTESVVSEETSLYQGLESFPDVQEESGDELQAHISLEPQQNTPTPAENNGDSIHFHSSHFKQEFSESEDEEGLFSQRFAVSDSVEHSHILTTPPSNLKTLVLDTSEQEESVEGAITCVFPDGQQAQNVDSSRLPSDQVTVESTVHASRLQRDASQNSDINIDEYEIVSESEISS
ncbi:reticulophagy regulator 3-like isoform X2 [Tachypleus tridentatus]|uniref:reticulophagy regulator 3-like isoform X2 n=1 Tax=Tachypleus tridentatus TaxID=6853 RepID=UPI003FD17F6B